MHITQKNEENFCCFEKNKIKKTRNEITRTKTTRANEKLQTNKKKFKSRQARDDELCNQTQITTDNSTTVVKDQETDKK